MSRIAGLPTAGAMLAVSRRLQTWAEATWFSCVRRVAPVVAKRARPMARPELALRSPQAEPLSALPQELRPARTLLAAAERSAASTHSPRFGIPGKASRRYAEGIAAPRFRPASRQ